METQDTRQRYNLTLDPELVIEAEINIKRYGGRISGLLNELLKNWIEEMEMNNNALNKEEKQT